MQLITHLSFAQYGNEDFLADLVAEACSKSTSAWLFTGFCKSERIHLYTMTSGSTHVLWRTGAVLLLSHWNQFCNLWLFTFCD